MQYRSLPRGRATGSARSAARRSPCAHHRSGAGPGRRGSQFPLGCRAVSGKVTAERTNTASPCPSSSSPARSTTCRSPSATARSGTCGRCGFQAMRTWRRSPSGCSASAWGAICCGPRSRSILGCLLGTFFMAFHSTQGPQLGLPQMIQSRPQFGYTGALLVWGVALVAYIGYTALQSGAGRPGRAPAGAGGLGHLPDGDLRCLHCSRWHWPRWATTRSTWRSGCSRYFMIAILTVFSVGALVVLRFPAAQWDPAGFRGVPFLAQLFFAASYQLSWSIYVSDYSRYLPREVGVRESFWWTYLGAFIGGAWMMLVGTVAAATAPNARRGRRHGVGGRPDLSGLGPGAAWRRRSWAWWRSRRSTTTAPRSPC